LEISEKLGKGEFGDVMLGTYKVSDLQRLNQQEKKPPKLPLLEQKSCHQDNDRRADTKNASISCRGHSNDVRLREKEWSQYF